MERIDAKLETALRRAEPAIGDDGFSDAVMGRLPRKRLGNTALRRLTLAGAAAAGSVLTLVLGAPVEAAFGVVASQAGGQGAALLAVLLLVALLAVPVAWAFYSR